MSLDLFANRASTVISSGGSDTPASGTSETFTVATVPGSASFPVASSAAVPPVQFRIVDQAEPDEIMIVTNVGGTSNNTWTVTRGAEGTTPVSHSAGWTAQNIITAAGLDGRYGALGMSLFESYVMAVRPDQLSPMGAALNANGFNIINLKNGVNPQDAVAMGQLPVALSAAGNPLASDTVLVANTDTQLFSFTLTSLQDIMLFAVITVNNTTGSDAKFQAELTPGTGTVFASKGLAAEMTVPAGGWNSMTVIGFMVPLATGTFKWQCRATQAVTVKLNGDTYPNVTSFHSFRVG